MSCGKPTSFRALVVLVDCKYIYLYQYTLLTAYTQNIKEKFVQRLKFPNRSIVEAQNKNELESVIPQLNIINHELASEIDLIMIKIYELKEFINKNKLNEIADEVKKLEAQVEMLDTQIKQELTILNSMIDDKVNNLK